jgi:hypothetical protein
VGRRVPLPDDPRFLTPLATDFDPCLGCPRCRWTLRRPPTRTSEDPGDSVRCLGTSDVVGSVLGRPWSTWLAPPIPLAPDLGVTPGQPNRRTLNQRWKVRMLAGWGPQHAPMRTQTRWSPARPSAWHPPTPRLVVTAMQAAARADAAMHGSCPAGESRPGYARRADAEFCYSTPPDLRRRPAQHARRVRSQAWPDPACTTNTSLPVPVSIV